jgi:hypothetical protein
MHASALVTAAKRITRHLSRLLAPVDHHVCRMGAAGLTPILRTEEDSLIRAGVRKQPDLREDLPARRVPWICGSLEVCGGSQSAIQRLAKASAVVVYERYVDAAVAKLVKGFLKGWTTPIVLQTGPIRHPRRRLWLGLRFCLRLWLRLWLGRRQVRTA